MQFLVVGLDGKDADAKQRRAAARPMHIELGDELLASGNLWYGAALIDDAGQMIGSMYFVDFPNRTEFEAWLEREPYVVGDVWKTITVHPANVRDPWQFNRPRDFFEKRQT
jgi:uncharacterized protein YciI